MLLQSNNILICIIIAHEYLRIRHYKNITQLCKLISNVNSQLCKLIAMKPNIIRLLHNHVLNTRAAMYQITPFIRITTYIVIIYLTLLYITIKVVDIRQSNFLKIRNCSFPNFEKTLKKRLFLADMVSRHNLRRNDQPYEGG